MQYTKALASSLLLILGVFAVSPALADEVDFYIFKTTHNETANKKAKFSLYVRRTNLLNYRIDDQDEYRCLVTPAAPDSYSCTIKKVYMTIQDNETSAREILRERYGVADNQVTEFKKVRAGVYQAVLKDDDIYHVTMEAPKVLDDSMECVLSAVLAKKLATLSCRSEFQAEQAFMVRNLPILQQDGQRFVFGSYAFDSYYDDEREKYDAVRKDAIAKVRELLDGIQKLKRLAPIAVGQTVYNVTLNLTPDSRHYDQLSWKGARIARGSVDEFQIDEEVEHINKNNLRRGD